ncbi:MAG: hypothetical protein IJ781_01695 [Atopobiaceae bacterium]|nr:hypothetical protein [Atopobiaceae bacterium]
MSQESDKPRGVFDDFSFSAVVASALTAATSFLLTSKIGLAGSLIGAMVAAVISTASTQVYKGMLTASAERIKEVAEPTISSGQHVAKDSRHAYAPTHDIGRIARRLAIFAACVSLVAVLVSAAIIALATRGEGLGPTTWEYVPAVEEVSEAGTEMSEEATAETDGSVDKVDGTVTESASVPTDAVTEDVTAEAPADTATDGAQQTASEPSGGAEGASSSGDLAQQSQPLTDQGLTESVATSSADAA